MRITGRLHYPTIYDVYLESRQTCWFYPSFETLLLVLTKIERLVKYQNLPRADKLTAHVLSLSYKYEHKRSHPIESTIYPNLKQYDPDKLDIDFYTHPKRYVFELTDVEYREKLYKTLSGLVKLADITIKLNDYYISEVPTSVLSSIDKLFASNYGSIPLFYELDKQRLVIPYARDPYIPHISEKIDSHSIVIPHFELKRVFILPEIELNYSEQKLIIEFFRSFRLTNAIDIQDIKYPKHFIAKTRREYTAEYKLNTAYRTYPMLSDKKLESYENVYSFLSCFNRVDYYNVDRYVYFLTFSLKAIEITEKTSITARDIVGLDSKNWLQSKTGYNKTRFTLTVRLLKRSSGKTKTSPVESNKQSKTNLKHSTGQTNSELQIRELSRTRREIITNVLEAINQSTALFARTKLIKESPTLAIKELIGTTTLDIERLESLSMILDVLYEFESDGLRVIITPTHIYLKTNEGIFRVKTRSTEKWHFAYRKGDLIKIVLLEHCDRCKNSVSETNLTIILVHSKKQKAVSITQYFIPVNYLLIPKKLKAILKRTRYYVYKKTPLFQPIDGQTLYESLAFENEIPPDYNKFSFSLEQGFSIPYSKLNYDTVKKWYIPITTFILPDILRYKIRISTSRQVKVARDNIKRTLTLREVPFMIRQDIEPSKEIRNLSLSRTDEFSEHEIRALEPTGYLLVKTYKNKTPVVLKLDKNKLNITAQRYTHLFKTSLRTNN